MINCFLTSSRSWVPSSGNLMNGISFGGGLFFVIRPVIAIIVGTVCFSVVSRSSVVFAEIIFTISGLFEIEPLNPSMKIMSSCSFFNMLSMLSKLSIDPLVFFIIAISSGEEATVILDPACVNLHVLVPSLSIVKPSL